MPPDRIRVLFLCVRNDCRSQMAEAWARHLTGGRIESWSAGIVTGTLDPYAVQVMHEAGVDISSHDSKQVNDLLTQPFDWVITVADLAALTCPIFSSNSRTMHHGFADPSELRRSGTTDTEALAQYRITRDDIRVFVKSLCRVLLLN